MSRQPGPDAVAHLRRRRDPRLREPPGRPPRLQQPEGRGADQNVSSKSFLKSWLFRLSVGRWR